MTALNYVSILCSGNISLLFDAYPAKWRNLDSVSFTTTIFWIIPYKIHLHIRSAFLLEFWKGTLVIKESFKCDLSVIYCLCYRFWVSFLDPGILWMTRKILVVKPYSKLAAAHKLFATFMKLLIMSKIEIIDKSASTYCFTNLDFLLLCRIYFRLETLQQFPHPFLSVFYTYKTLCSLQENTWSIETISCTRSPSDF